MASEYIIQVAHKITKEVVTWAPGLRIEREFEKHSLSARDVFTVTGKGLEARTVIHSIHF